jgi:hypothetical protein
VQSTVKGLKRKIKKTKAYATGYFFHCIKNIEKCEVLRVLGLLAKIYPRVFGLTATLDSRVIFIILIIILNLHDSSLIESSCNSRPKSLGCRSDCKIVL